jgi:integrase
MQRSTGIAYNGTAIALALLFSGVLNGAELKPETAHAWADYLARADTRMMDRAHCNFLWVDESEERLRRVSAGRAKLLVTALRSFLRYLRHQDRIPVDLAGCVPPVAFWSLSTVPKFLPAGTVQRVLSQCERETADGKRNYAVLLMLARLGLRACEIVALNLDDIDWDNGLLTIRCKGGRWAQLPMPTDVGEAIAVYVHSGRPRTLCRRVFLRHRAPIRGFAHSITVSTIVSRALIRGGIDSVRKGAHLFRHTLATDLLRQGASLDEIGDLLRHRSPNTTAVYAKVDLIALRTLALPWLGGAR